MDKLAIARPQKRQNTAALQNLAGIADSDCRLRFGDAVEKRAHLSELRNANLNFAR